MLSDEFPEMGVRNPEAFGGTPVTLYLYVEEVDALTVRSLEAGAKALRPLADQFYGDSTVKLEDPFGHVWIFATHLEDVSEEEMRGRAAKLFGAILGAVCSKPLHRRVN